MLTLIKPDDFHIHLRDGAYLHTTVPHAARQFRRAIVMPNLQPPVVTVDMALAYRQRILAALPKGMEFTPLMTLYLTETTTVEEIVKAKQSDAVYAVKLYPAGATTHSAAGVQKLEKVYPVFEAMEAQDLPLLVHGEVVDHDIDIFDRERIFIERHLSRIVETFPNLRIVLEHITTSDAVAFVSASRQGVAATITPHHLLYNRNQMLVGGIKPHYYCLPVLKRETSRQALLQAAMSGNPKFFLGTDSAPHAKGKKEQACGCAGIYNAYTAIELYATIFQNHGVLEKLENFSSVFGAQFYGLERNQETISLIEQAQTVPDQFPFGDEEVIPLAAGETLSWQLVD